MGAFGELLKVYWGGGGVVSYQPPKPLEKSDTELKYEEDRKDFENSPFSYKERKTLISYMGDLHNRRSCKLFMNYKDWLKFTENGIYHYWEVINKMVK